jgi:hypothetical protein
MKPKVGIIFSESEKDSNESKNLAYYFCGLLSATGYANVSLFGYRSDGLTSDTTQKKIYFIPMDKKVPQEVPVCFNIILFFR